MSLSVSGDQVPVEPLPPPPHPAAPSYLQSLDLEVGFNRRGYEISEQFSSDEMTRNFIKAFSGLAMSQDQILVFEFHGQNLKATVKSVSVLDLADEQRKGVPTNAHQSGNHNFTGILMDKTDVTFIKAADSLIKIKGSSKK